MSYSRCKYQDHLDEWVTQQDKLGTLEQDKLELPVTNKEIDFIFRCLFGLIMTYLFLKTKKALYQ